VTGRTNNPQTLGKGISEYPQKGIAKVNRKKSIQPNWVMEVLHNKKDGFPKWACVNRHRNPKKKRRGRTIRILIKRARQLDDQSRNTSDAYIHKVHLSGGGQASPCWFKVRKLGLARWGERKTKKGTKIHGFATTDSNGRKVPNPAKAPQ